MNEKNKDDGLDSSNINGNNRPMNGSSGGSCSDAAGWHRGYVQGNTFSNKEVMYRISNGMAIFEGDIILAETPKD